MVCRLQSTALRALQVLVGCLTLVGSQPLAWSAESQWVTTGTTGRLVYVPDAEGDRVLDFSNVGYQGKATALIPNNVANSVTVAPITGDDTASIQAAINQVSALPLGPNGYRGAVLLQAGTYDIDSQLEIRASGVVLRGVGRGTGETVLHGRNPLSGGTNPNQRPLVRVFGNGSRTNVGSTHSLIDKVVPAGSRSFRVSSTSGFSVGDTVRIERPRRRSGPHQRWASGTLFDNITVQGNAINARFRGSFGTSHGWSGANMVVWNSTADSFRIQNPPTAQNWLVGSTGTIVEDTTFGPQPSGNYDSHGSPVTTGGTTSLYEAQLNDAQDIEEFHAVPGGGNWADAAQWDQQVAPLDAYEVSLRDYLIGDIDSFTHDGGGSVDDALIDPAWATDIANSSAHPIVGFDSLTTNQNVAFTIQHVLDAGEQVIHGFLALGLKQSGGLVDTDFVRLFDMDAEHKLNFSDLGWDSQINASNTFVGVLDLGAFLDELQSGSVNVQLNDDTGLDWAMYTVAVATPRGDSSSTKVFVDGDSVVTVDSVINSVGQLNLGTIGAGTLIVTESGKVDVDGDFSQSATGALAIEISGESAGQFGSMDVLRNAVLSGSLDVTFGASFQPDAGDSFQILSADSISGTFDDVFLPNLGGDLAWIVEYQSASVLLAVTFTADFNGDGTVDSLDLAELQRHYGSLSANHSQGDADGDGDVDGHDFLTWQRQVGSIVPLSAIVQIPEPSAVFLTLVALAIMLPYRLSRLR